MSEKPSIIGVGILSLFISIVFEIFFIVCWIAAYSQTLQENNSDANSRDKFNVLIYIFYGLAVFISFFLYYVMVFVVATAVAYWYYRDDSKGICYGYGPLRYNVGSITFAAVVITIITLLRRAAQQ
jgi:hypothetical protein